MINKKVQDAINKQINAELYSAYLYLSMASYFNSINLKGFAGWMKVQVQEEMVHAIKFFNYLNDRGGRAILAPIDGPKIEWKSPLEAFVEANKHEQKVTALINDLTSLAMAEKDHASHTFLQWYVTEQVEEESSTDAVVQKLKLIGAHTESLFLLDQEMATRVFVLPPEFLPTAKQA
jgi:ferritin